MMTVVIIFMIIATIFALASLAYVGVDFYMEHRSKKAPEASAEPEIPAEQEETAEQEEPATVTEEPVADPQV